MPGFVYFDTDVFHRAGQAVATHPLPLDLRARILVSPITALEALSHLTLKKGDEILGHIHAMHNWLNPADAGLLPWPSVAVANLGFGIPFEEEDAVDQAVNSCLCTHSAKEVRASAGALKDVLDRMKAEATISFQQLVEAYRREPLNSDQFSEKWAYGLAHRVKADPKSRPIQEIVGALSAYHEFEEEKLKLAARDTKYNPDPNDILDSLQLVYLGDPALHFLTCDGGYLARVKKSPFVVRIQKVSVGEFADAVKLKAFLRKVTE
jgi:hypothetical protein